MPLQHNAPQLDSVPLKRGRPVSTLPIEFEWHGQPWLDIFDRQVEVVKSDILRALAQDRLVAYLSCPVSSRGGGVTTTNLDVANHTVRRLTAEWGNRFWFVNPGQYQLESTQGATLLGQHAKSLTTEGSSLSLAELQAKVPPTGGDYMRMWTRVLAEDNDQNLGANIAVIYFIGPSDYRHFFVGDTQTSLSSGVEDYFSRTFSLDRQFNKYFSGPFTGDSGNPLTDQEAEWKRRRKDFLQFYTTRASAGFSRGSHDEWNIWVALNKGRMQKSDLGIGQQIPGFFDGHQIDPAAATISTEPGYAIAARHLGEQQSP